MANTSRSNELSSKHPQYIRFLEDWALMQVAYEGERRVKEQGITYLPPTSGMEQDGMNEGQPGYKRYNAYKARAVFPDFVSDAVEGMIGIMHRKPAVIEVPNAMEGMLESLSNEQEDAQLLLRRINEMQLVLGRGGLLLDLPENPDPTDPQMYVALYGGGTVINWDKGRRDRDGIYETQLVVLDETEFVRNDNFSWEEMEKYRVLSIQDTVNPDDEETAGPKAYHYGVFAEDGKQGNALSFNQAGMTAPMMRGQVFDKIPFVFINSKDTLPDPDNPPLLGLANLCMTIYRGEADYRHSLFMQGQDVLVRIGYIDTEDEDETRTGAGSIIDLPQGGDAKYIGVESQGLSEQRQALENDKKAALNKAGQMLDTGSKAKESGDALRVRVAAQTATLVHIALAGAAALERTLKMAAEWQGLNPEDVSVQPNLDFADDKLVGKELMDLMSAKTLGAPLSKKSIHAIMRRRELTEMDFEEEMDEIADEEPEATGEGVIEDEDELDNDDQQDNPDDEEEETDGSPRDEET